MRELAKALSTHNVQSQVRRSMQHVSSFKLEVDLPESLLLKLEELDRAVAAREAQQA